jgi:cytochrome c oxidase cbb3-type subunit 1
MWRAYDELGFLQYSFVESVEAMHPYYIIRALGGILFLLGALIMVYNLWRTMRGDIRAGEPVVASDPTTEVTPATAAAPN